MGIYFKLRAEEFIALLITITLVLSAELLNTALEKAVDLCCSESSPLARAAKDAAAGAVLLASVNAAAVGIILLGRKIFELAVKFLNA